MVLLEPCFSTVANFLACCADPDVFDPAAAGCPTEFLESRATCCTPDTSHRFLEVVAADFDLGEASGGSIALLSTYLLDFNHRDMQAWRLLVHLAAVEAINGANHIKRKVKPASSIPELTMLYEEALSASRQVTQALSLIESYHQLLLWDKATKEQLVIDDVAPETVRVAFEHELGDHSELAMNHDLLAFSVLPSVESTLADARGAALPCARGARAPIINLLVVSLGDWAKIGFSTLWSLVKRTSARLRIFVFGNPKGLESWRGAVAELNTTQGPNYGRHFLEGVLFEYIDFAAHPGFKAYLQRYPEGCTFGPAGEAMLARVVCHLLLPEDVDRVISLDTGDVLVLDDIRQLWDIGDEIQEHQVLAAAHAVSLNHINAGVVVYHVARMRLRGFAALTLRAAEDGLRAGQGRDGSCLRDQQIINVLHSHREQFDYEGPSPVMLLPCRWSVFPVTEWQLSWNSPEMWLPEVVARRRYPGFLSTTHVEVYCPDVIDLLATWAFMPLSGSRQERLRTYAYHLGKKSKCYCAYHGTFCCGNGERAALVHLAGDLKAWPSMHRLLFAHQPAWSEAPKDELNASLSRAWWGGSARREELLRLRREMVQATSMVYDWNVEFKKGTDLCHTFKGPEANTYYQAHVEATALPVALRIETTALSGVRVMIYSASVMAKFEVVMGERVCVEWRVYSVAEASIVSDYCGDLIRPRQAQDEWTKFSFGLSDDNYMFEVRADFVERGSSIWGSYLPNVAGDRLASNGPLSVWVSSEEPGIRWLVCRITGV
eukprot:TRINITY_DN16213_c0_g1_i1.p1 TRINITY_DN16213_c0_g1~~TRINITY_DN16213_c0_g1_i1.p1  ORF type:complete len:775 (-),score=97.02 TRINITY_DN16213_c0_g1_i1:118-2442(-)